MRALAMACSLSAAWAVMGCSPNEPPMVDTAQAEQTLNSVLEAWKAGESSRDQTQKAPPVFVADEAWDAGSELIAFSIQESVARMGPSARFRVELQCRSPRGGMHRRLVRYCVTTTPALTIAREE